MVDQNSAPDERRDEDYGLARELVGGVMDAVEDADRPRVLGLIEDLHAADLADLVEQIGKDRRAFVELVWDDVDQDFLVELEEGVRDEVLAFLGKEKLAGVARELDSDDLIYLVQDMDEDVQKDVLASLDPVEREVVARSLTYPDYSAGRLMQAEVVKAPPFWTVGQMIDVLRAMEELPEPLYDIVIIDLSGKPVGKVALSSILGNRRPVTLGSIMADDFRTLHVEDEQEAVAYAFNQYHLVSCPVVDDDGRLMGVITIDDAMEVLEEEADEDIKRLAGVGDEGLSDNVWEITKRRFPWLAVNLATAILASGVIAVFEDALQQLVALAVLMPIVASMGGNAATQTLTVAVRAIATRDLTGANAARVVGREAAVGLANGCAFAIIMGLVAWYWFGDPGLGAVIAVAMVANLLVAGLAGILVPIGLERAGADPALASGTFVTTVTDVVGFFAFLGLAALLLL